ncbi:MAG: hypothetical protein QM535_20545 [Limnohabitans sp.]|nr:hypothetical protein [Limnohabitans sp.]
MKSNYQLENLNSEEFEDLVIAICRELLGISCKTFSSGKDGAKDSFFNGTAQNFPSLKNSWSGSFIIQAKHVKSSEASCSDNDFSVNKSSILQKEIDRLNEIKIEQPFNNYILFTNRKLTGNTHPEIVEKLRKELNIDNTEIIGREQISSYLDYYPHIANKFGIYKFTTPLRFYEKDLKDVIIFFNDNRKKIANESHNYINQFDNISKEEKNKLNNLSSDYFNFIKKHSLMYFTEIDNFLKDPKNETYTKYYANTISDLQAKILLERERFNDFKELLEHIISFVVENNEDNLREHRLVVRVFVHFMYFNCDIGKTK